MITNMIVVSTFAHAYNPVSILSKADSMYIKKQYTQSFEIYQSLHQQGYYTPAMLLKMAYIQEGLGSTGLSLYNLNLYYLASGDTQVLNKLEELASKNRLEGYGHSETTRFLFNLKKYRLKISISLAVITLFLIVLQYKQSKKDTKPLALGVVTALFIVLLAIQVNLSYDYPEAIVTDSAYLMSGPSAGANVVALIKEGHKLKISGKKDIWLKVEWLDKESYVKENQVVRVAL